VRVDLEALEACRIKFIRIKTVVTTGTTEGAVIVVTTGIIIVLTVLTVTNNPIAALPLLVTVVNIPRLNL
jgi:hypothetical protein